MNTNQMANLIKYAEKSEWKDFYALFEKEFGHLSFENKIEKIKSYQKNQNHLKQNIKINAVKWMINQVSTSWIIESNKNEHAKKLVDEYLMYLNFQQAITILNLLWSEGEITYSIKLVSHIWNLAPAIKEIEKQNIVDKVLIHTKDPHILFQALTFAIDIGDQIAAARYYQRFYQYYFEKFDLEDIECQQWEILWGKLGTVGEKWFIWEVMKLDVGFITDIIIKNKTGLKVPHFRKKREISQAILLRKEWTTLNSTLVKYFSSIESNELISHWLNFHGESNKGFDNDTIQKIEDNRLSKPKDIPFETNLMLEDTQNITQLIDQEIDQLQSIDVVTIKNKLLHMMQNKSNVELHSAMDKSKTLNWKEKINILLLHEDLEGVLKILNENKDTITQEEKNDFDIFTLELYVKTGQYQEVLKKLESVWKNVQELEVFKIYKYLEGEALWMLNRKREAIDCYKKVVDIDPNYKLAKWRLTEYNA